MFCDFCKELIKGRHATVSIRENKNDHHLKRGRGPVEQNLESFKVHDDSFGKDCKRHIRALFN